jgi:hypothetical protein
VINRGALLFSLACRVDFFVRQPSAFVSVLRQRNLRPFFIECILGNGPSIRFGGRLPGVRAMTDHDRLFKELISTFFQEFLELFLPELRAYLEAGSIEFLDKEIFVDVTSGHRLEPDLVAKVRFKGRPSFFIIHVENQAQAQTEFGRRFFRYFSRLHDKYNLPVYPIVVFSF